MAGISFSTRFENILNKINFSVNGFTQVLEFDAQDKGCLSGGIDILMNVFDELNILKDDILKELNKHDTEVNKDTNVVASNESISTTPVSQPPVSNNLINNQFKQTPDLNKKNQYTPPPPRKPFVSSERRGETFGTKIPIDQFLQNKTSTNVVNEKPKESSTLIPTELIAGNVNTTLEEALDNLLSESSETVTYKLTESEASLSNIEVEIMEFLSEHPIIWMSYGSISKELNRSRPTIVKYITMLLDKQFLENKEMVIKTRVSVVFRLAYNYRENLDKVKYIITFCKK